MSEIVTYPSLKDKVVLVTGGASGIGESIVKKFLEQGSKVAFIDIEESFGQDLVKKLDSYNHKALFKKCDLVDIKSLKKTIIINILIIKHRGRKFLENLLDNSPKAPA